MNSLLKFITCGVVEHTLRRSDNLTWHQMDITREFRANQKGQTPKTIWLTGLSGSGKSSLANELEKALRAKFIETRKTVREQTKKIDKLEKELANQKKMIQELQQTAPFFRIKRKTKHMFGKDK